MYVEVEVTKCAPGGQRKMWGLQCAKYCMLVATFVNIVAIIVVCIFIRQDKPRNADRSEDAKSDHFLVSTPGCRIPDLAARDSLVLQYVTDVKPVPKCSEVTYLIGKRKQRGPPLVQSNLTAMWVVREAMHHYNVSDLACCYRPFWRVQDDPVKYKKDADRKEKFSKTCIKFDEVKEMNNNEEFMEVECYEVTSQATSSGKVVPNLRGDEIYRDFHAFVPIKLKVEERCDKIPHTDDQVSVLMLGLDAMSRLNMLRELPLLHEALTSLSAISLLGYNKVGDNTFPNVMPILTGLDVDELTEACPWPSSRHKLDPCPFIWKEFAKRGYRTAYGGDCTWMSIFNHEKTGFVEAPTDYYLRPFMRILLHQGKIILSTLSSSQQVHAAKKQWTHKIPNPMQIISTIAEKSAHTTLLHANLCLGPRLTISYILDYVKKFTTRFEHQRTFSFFWATSLSHDNLTVPHNGDLIISQLVRELAVSGALNRTVLIMLSDHGIRYGGIRETYQGMMEERLPFMYIAFPDWFKRRFPAAVSNVRLNARRLTTPFDLHATLRDLLDPAGRLQDDVLRSREKDLLPSSSDNSFVDNIISKYNKWRSKSMKTGISLFLPIPPERTCEDANISPHYCTCQTSKAISVNSTIARRAAHFLVSRLNDLLSGTPQCARLRLDNVRGARQGEPERWPGDEHALLLDYTVTVQTQPGGGVFEATVRQVAALNVTSSLHLAGPISRLNLYGNQSTCVDNYKIKMYCYC